MMLPGECTECNMPRNVRVTGSAIATAHARGQLHRVKGICVSCQRKEEHVRNPRPDDLHHENGTHRHTAKTANGRDLERHEIAIRRHLADGHTHRQRW